jgi:hypothetical protein
VPRPREGERLVPREVLGPAVEARVRVPVMDGERDPDVDAADRGDDGFEPSKPVRT